MADGGNALPARLTPTLRALLQQYKDTLPEPDYRDLIRYIEEVAAGYHAELTRHLAGAPRARALHRLVDAEAHKLQGVTATCKAGCCACCHYEVETTTDESVLLASLVTAGLPIDRERLAEQAARERNSPRWRTIVVQENRCVFLADDGRCGVYEDRPSACRKLLVVSPAELCATPGAIPQPIDIPLADLALSVALSLPDNPSSSLPKGLARALGSRLP